MKRIHSSVILVLVITVLVVLAVLSIKQEHDVWRAGAIGCLSQARLAVANYEYRNGKLPPICVRDENGAPLLSWRALVLSELEGGSEVQQRLDLSAPWSSVHNRELILATGDSLSGYFTREDREGFVCVFALEGQNSLWRSEPNARLTIENDGDRVLLLYIPSKQVELLQPVEVTESELRTLIENGEEAFFITGNRTHGDVRIVDDHLRYDSN